MVIPGADERETRTLDQPRAALRQVFEDDIAAPISHIAVQWRLILILGDRISYLDDTAGALS